MDTDQFLITQTIQLCELEKLKIELWTKHKNGETVAIDGSLDKTFFFLGNAIKLQQEIIESHQNKQK